MGFRKFMVRLLNLGYLAGAGFAIYSMVTRPLIDVSASVKFPTSLISSVLTKQENGSGEGGNTDDHNDPAGGHDDQGGEGDKTKAYKRAGTPDITSMLTPEIINSAFEDINLDISFKVPPLLEYMQLDDAEKPLIFNTAIQGALNDAIDTVTPMLTTGFKVIVENVAKTMAQEALGGALNEMLTSSFEGVEGLSTEQVTEVVDTLWEALSEEDATVDTVVDALADSANDIIAAMAETNPDLEGVVLDEEMMDDIKDTLGDMLSEVGLADEDGNIQDIDSALAMLLQMFMGGDEGGETQGGGEGGQQEENRLPTPTGLEFDEGSMTFFWDPVDGAFNYTISINGTEDTTSEPSYHTELADGSYTITVVANPEEGAKVLSSNPATLDLKLVDGEVFKSMILRDDPITPAPEGEEGGTGTEGGEQSSEDQLNQMVSDFIKSFLKKADLDKLNVNLDEMIGMANVTTYAMIAIVALVAFPWALFVLITFFRTLRPKKCWTKTWVVFFFAFLQIIFGAAITLGIQYGLPLAMPMVKDALGSIPEAATYVDVLDGLTLSIQTICYIPSLVYLAMIPYTIFYLCFSVGVKRQFKREKREAREAKRAAKLAAKNAQ